MNEYEKNDPKGQESFSGRRIEWVIIEECDDLADLSDEYPVPSILKLIAKLAFRMTLVIALAVGVLAVIS